MLTQIELNALVQLLNRLPMTSAEMLWVNGFIRKLETIAEPPGSAQPPHSRPGPEPKEGG